MKRIILLLLSLCICISLASCVYTVKVNENEEIVSVDNPKAPEIPTATSNELEGGDAPNVIIPDNPVVVTPEKPDEPITPEPIDPIVPIEPIKPIEPVEPNLPIEPVESEESDEKAETQIEPWQYFADNAKETEEGKNASYITFELTHSDGEYAFSGENLEYLNDVWVYASASGLCFKFDIEQRSMDALLELSRALYKCRNYDFEGIFITEDTAPANEIIDAYVNSESVKVIELREGKGNGHQDFYIYLDSYIGKDEFKSLSLTVNKGEVDESEEQDIASPNELG